MPCEQYKTVLIAGASGVIGQAAVTHFEALADWRVVAISRRRPKIQSPERIQYLPVDLTDADACWSASETLDDVTHLVYCAVREKPDLVAGWRDGEQMATNLSMLRNLVEPLLSRGQLRHISLLQGTKAYGAHLHAVPIPAQESQPRDPHENFYWLQEDYLRDRCRRSGVSITVLRPQIVFGNVDGKKFLHGTNYAVTTFTI
jgi:nucleoside-diphosphate-sugar epimerase